MDFLTLAKKRCTTRGFMEKEILSKDLEQILSCLLYTSKHISEVETVKNTALHHNK